MASQLNTRHKLKLWEALTLSVGLMAPTLAMSLNGVGVAGLVGKSVPLVFALGFLGVATVAYGFVRLTRYFNHAGSVYALAGVTIGPRAGFFGGFALLATYVFFAMSTLASTGVFLYAFLDELGSALRPSWILIGLLTAAVVFVLSSRESRITARTLFIVEGIGIVAMLVLAVIIVTRAATGTAPDGQALDISTFAPSGNSASVLLTATVFAFLSWAGFEACASLGEETDNPRRNIPGALIGALLITAVLYVFVMFAQTIGFGTDATGVDAFANSESSLVDLGKQYAGVSFGLVLSFTALVASVGSALGSTTAASRLVFALARDGFGPKQLARINESGAPTTAAVVVLVTAVAGATAFWASGAAPFDVYYWTATIGVLTLLVVYAVAAAGVIAFTLRGTASIPRWEVLIPAIAIVYLTYVFYKQSVGQTAPYNYFPYIAGGWCLIGLMIAVGAPQLTRRIGARLSAELAANDSDATDAPAFRGTN